MSNINFDNVYLLFIAIPIAVLFAVPFFIAIRRDNRNGHNIASVAMHVVLAVIIAFAAAGTKIVTVVTQTEVYVVADVSYSANKNLDTVDSYISNLGKSLPRNSRMGVICFGKDYDLLASPGASIAKVATADVDDSETNIVPALQYASSLFKGNVIKRVVLITDALQTYDTDCSELRSQIESMRAQSIHIDAIYLNDNITDDATEMQISFAEFTGTAYKNNPEKAVYTIQSSFDSPDYSTTLTLTKNGEAYETKHLKLSRGTNIVEIELDTQESGSYEYVAVLTDERDESSLNNSYTFTQVVSDEMNVLLVTENASDIALAQNYYGETARVSAFGLDAPDFPIGIEELCKYDEILLSDVDLTEMNDYQMFLQSLDTVVSSFGKSLVTMGNLKVQDKLEDELKQLDDMLPVRFGDSVGTPKLYTIVLDVSGSMGIWSRMILAKQATKQLINFLNKDDYVCIITFAGDVEVLQAPTSLENIDAINEKIDNITTGGGTIVGIGLEKALSTIKNLSFSEKQVMLITDGLTFDGDLGESDQHSPELAVQAMLAYGIHTSVLAVGGEDVDRSWLENLASLGAGNYYYAKTEAELGAVLFGDIQQEATDSVITTRSWITVKRTRDDVLKDVIYFDSALDASINVNNKTYLSGFVRNSSKSSATDVLTVSYNVNNSNGEGKISVAVPLYSYWNYGNGKVASFTASFGSIMVSGGDATQTNTDFFKNVLKTNVPEEKTDYPYTVKTETDGKNVKISVNPPQLHTGAVAQISIVTPSGEQTGGKMIFDSSEYYYEFITPDSGRYAVTINYSYGGGTYSADASFTLSYAPEYDSFAVCDAAALHKLIGSEGTVSEDGKLTIVNDEDEEETYIQYLTVPLLIACVVIYVVDIAVRKLKWKDIVSLFKKINGNKKA